MNRPVTRRPFEAFQPPRDMLRHCGLTAPVAVQGNTVRHVGEIVEEWRLDGNLAAVVWRCRTVKRGRSRKSRSRGDRLGGSYLSHSHASQSPRRDRHMTLFRTLG